MRTPSFKWMQPDTLTASITIDKYRRIYISSEARRLLDVKGRYRFIVGFDHVNQRMIIAKPEIVRVADVKPFVFDKRNYAHAKRFVRELGFTDDELPMKFDYVGKDYGEYPDGAYVFQREGFEAPDDRGGVFSKTTP